MKSSCWKLRVDATLILILSPTQVSDSCKCNSLSGEGFIQVLPAGVVVSAHQALLFPHSQYLQSLMDPGDACGCTHDAPTLLLPDFDHKVIKALLNLLYSGRYQH